MSASLLLKTFTVDRYILDVCQSKRFPEGNITRYLYLCISAVRMASSESTRELALKTTSSALLMSRSGQQWSQFPLGLGHLHFCELTALYNYEDDDDIV